MSVVPSGRSLVKGGEGVTDTVFVLTLYISRDWSTNSTRLQKGVNKNYREGTHKVAL